MLTQLGLDPRHKEAACFQLEGNSLLQIVGFLSRKICLVSSLDRIKRIAKQSCIVDTLQKEVLSVLRYNTTFKLSSFPLSLMETSPFAN